MTGVERALATAVELARVHGVRVQDPLVLADGANLVVHLRPAPLVAKVALSTHLIREPAQWLARELTVAAHLDRTGAPVVRASDLLPTVVHAILMAGGVDRDVGSVPLPVALAAGTLAEGLWRLLRRQDEPPLTRFLARQLATSHWFDISAARRDLGYAPTVGLDEGFRRLAASLAR